MGEKSNLAREKILSEFYHLVCRQGYKQSSLRQLGDICEMSTGHINFYFKKKDKLAIAISEVHLTRAYAIINEHYDIHEDEFTLFLLHHILLFYLTSKRKITHRIVSELHDNKEFMFWRAKIIYSYVKSALHKIEFFADNNDIMDACVSSAYGIYALLHKYYIDKQSFDYQRVFRIFMQMLFVQIGFTQIDAYLERALRLFAGLDKDELLAQFKFIFHYE